MGKYLYGGVLIQMTYSKKLKISSDCDAQRKTGTDIIRKQSYKLTENKH